MLPTDFGYYNFEYTLDCIKKDWEDFHKNPGKYEGREIDWAMEQTGRIMHIQYAINTSVLLKDESERNTQFKEEFLFAHTENTEIEQLKNPILFNTEVEAEATNQPMDEEIKLEVLGKNDSKYAELENMSVEDIFKKELSAWGIHEGSFAYKCAISLSKVGTPGMAYKDAIKAVANDIGTNSGIVSLAFSNLVKKANFGRTIYNPILPKLQHITKEILVRELLDFCE